MKTQLMLSAVAGLVMSASAMAATPESYDTKFNVSANVPDSAMLADASGNPITDMDVVLKPAGDYMVAVTDPIMLWNNDVAKLEVALTLDDGRAATGDPFYLSSNQGGVLNELTYKISTITSEGSELFAASGDSKDYTLRDRGTHGDLPISFKFVSDKTHKELAQGNYTGVVYANVTAIP